MTAGIFFSNVDPFQRHSQVFAEVIRHAEVDLRISFGVTRLVHILRCCVQELVTPVIGDTRLNTFFFVHQDQVSGIAQTDQGKLGYRRISVVVKADIARYGGVVTHYAKATLAKEVLCRQLETIDVGRAVVNRLRVNEGH